MQQTGILRTWHDDRGFGFIAPAGGGRELFVHISAFPRDGTRPAVGETLGYELGRGKDGKPAALRVTRKAWGESTDRSSRLGELPTRAPAPKQTAWHAQKRTHGSMASGGWLLVKLCLIVGALLWGFTELKGRYARHQLAGQPVPEVSVPAHGSEAAAYRCDGRAHCSQMTSCGEAKFFIKNCPGTKMDSDNDGVPCEQQWCTSPFED